MTDSITEVISRKSKEEIMNGITSALNRFLNSEGNRMARRTDYNTGECRMKDTSASCFHYPSRFRREWAQVQDALEASESVEITEKIETYGYKTKDGFVVSTHAVNAADVTVTVNGVEYSLTIKS